MKGEYLKLETVKTLAELLNENKELQERIDKAIDYIKNNSWYCYKDNEEELARLEIEKLLKILKGVQND